MNTLTWLVISWLGWMLGSNELLYSHYSFCFLNGLLIECLLKALLPYLLCGIHGDLALGRQAIKRNLPKMRQKAEKEWMLQFNWSFKTARKISRLAVNSNTRIIYSAFWYVFLLSCLPNALPLVYTYLCGERNPQKSASLDCCLNEWFNHRINWTPLLSVSCNLFSNQCTN